MIEGLERIPKDSREEIIRTKEGLILGLREDIRRLRGLQSKITDSNYGDSNERIYMADEEIKKLQEEIRLLKPDYVTPE